jgi:Protein of unknown function (DUF1569)
MKSLAHEETRREIHERIGRLRQDRAALWGRMSAPQMVAHCADSIRMGLGQLPTKSKKLPLRYPPLKQLFVYWLPFPKGAPTSPELIARKPSDWNKETADLGSLVDAVGERNLQGIWPEHPAFGRLNGRAWCILGYRHLDHHLRQFGA